MMEVYEVAKICDGLAHPIRAKIYDVLSKKKEMKISEIYKEIAKEFDISSRQTLMNHLKTMALAGIVEMRKEGKEWVVKLIKKIDITAEEFA